MFDLSIQKQGHRGCLRKLPCKRKRRLLREGRRAQAEAPHLNWTNRLAGFRPRKETLEALEAGRKVIAGLEGLSHVSLESAQGLGDQDAVIGEDCLARRKHSHLDKAPEQVHEVQALMRRFQEETADISRFTRT